MSRAGGTVEPDSHFPVAHFQVNHVFHFRGVSSRCLTANFKFHRNWIGTPTCNRKALFGDLATNNN